jgi:hypothetical protein
MFKRYKFVMALLQFDWDNIISDKDKACLLVLDQTDYVIEAELHHEGLLAGPSFGFTRSNSTSLPRQTMRLLKLSFGAISTKKLESESCGIPIESMSELCERGRDLETQREYLLLTLETDSAWLAWHSKG